MEEEGKYEHEQGEASGQDVLFELDCWSTAAGQKHRPLMFVFIQNEFEFVCFQVLWLKPFGQEKKLPTHRTPGLGLDGLIICNII